VIRSATAPDGRLYVISELHPHLFCSEDGGAAWENIPIGSGDFFLNALTIALNGDIYVAAKIRIDCSALLTEEKPGNISIPL